MLYLITLLIPTLLHSFKVPTGPTNCVSIERTEGTGECTIRTSCSQESLFMLNTHTFSFLCLKKRNKNGDEEKENLKANDTNVIDQKKQTLNLRRAMNLPIDSNPIIERHVYPACIDKDDYTNSTELASEELTDKNCFAAEQVFHTDEVCDECLPDVEVPNAIVSYGPSHCLSTFRSSRENTCVIQANCEPGSLSNINVGVTCVNTNGSMVQHMFGSNSFEDQEIYKTDIPCEMCLGVSDSQSAGVIESSQTNSTNSTDNTTAAAAATTTAAPTETTTTAAPAAFAVAESTMISDMKQLKQSYTRLTARIDKIERIEHQLSEKLKVSKKPISRHHSYELNKVSESHTNNNKSRTNRRLRKHHGSKAGGKGEENNNDAIVVLNRHGNDEHEGDDNHVSQTTTNQSGGEGDGDSDKPPSGSQNSEAESSVSGDADAADNTESPSSGAGPVGDEQIHGSGDNGSGDSNGDSQVEEQSPSSDVADQQHTTSEPDNSEAAAAASSDASFNLSSETSMLGDSYSNDDSPDQGYSAPVAWAGAEDY